MKVRQHGTPAECEAAAAVIATVLEVASTSRPYRDRAPSALVRVYLEVRLPDPTAAPALPATPPEVNR